MSLLTKDSAGEAKTYGPELFGKIINITEPKSGSYKNFALILAKSILEAEQKVTSRDNINKKLKESYARDRNLMKKIKITKFKYERDF